MTVLVFGKTGQVAQALHRQIPDAIFLDRAAADLSHPDACTDAIVTHAPHAVINAAAFTQVDRAETDLSRAMAINAAAPGAMARTCARMHIPLVHLSSDYVFDGSGLRAWQPNAQTAPINAYGRSKCRGEQAVRAANGPHVILRTSWVFSAHGVNFAKTMQRLGKDRAALDVVADQTGGPTPAADIATALRHIVDLLQTRPDLSGTYHFSGTPDVSWAEFARAIFTQADMRVQVRDVPSSAFPTPAKRPRNSRLDCSSLGAAFNIPRPDWHDGLSQVLAEVTA